MKSFILRFLANLFSPTAILQNLASLPVLWLLAYVGSALLSSLLIFRERPWWWIGAFAIALGLTLSPLLPSARRRVGDLLWTMGRSNDRPRYRSLARSGVLLEAWEPVWKPSGHARIVVCAIRLRATNRTATPISFHATEWVAGDGKAHQPIWVSVAREREEQRAVDGVVEATKAEYAAYATGVRSPLHARRPQEWWAVMPVVTLLGGGTPQLACSLIDVQDERHRVVIPSRPVAQAERS